MKTLFFALFVFSMGLAKPLFADTKKMTYIVSDADTTEYCNGDRMESDAYRKTLNKKITGLIEENATSRNAELKNFLFLAVKKSCPEKLIQSFDFKEEAEVLHIRPIETWPGSSIVMCGCKPAVDVNLLRVRGIKKVVWDEK